MHDAVRRLDVEDAMTRSEEELRVTTARRITGRVRVRKVIVTEDVTITVSVRREELRIERVPVTAGEPDTAAARDSLVDDELAIVLHAEEPVVEKRVVPKERVRIVRHVVTEQQTVSDDVRREQIDFETSNETRTSAEGEHETWQQADAT